MFSPARPIPPGPARRRPLRREPGRRLRCPAIRGQCHHLRPERLRLRPEHARRRRREDRHRHLLEDGEEPVRPRALRAALQAGHVQRHLQRRLLHPCGRPGAEPRRRADQRRRERQRQVDPNGNAPDNFWRTLENFAVTPSSDVPYKTTKGVTRIAVSQAAPLRRLHVKGELASVRLGLRRGTWAAPAAASWPTRSSTARSSPPRSSSGSRATASGPAGATPSGTWSSWAATTPPPGTFPNPRLHRRGPDARHPREALPLRRRRRRVPRLRPGPADQHAGASAGLDGPTPGTSIPIDRFYIAQPATATAAAINAALAAGKHILFTPGVYSLDDTLRVTRADTILLGLGVPSLIPTAGLPIISVADVDGVKIAGLILDAGPGQVADACWRSAPPAARPIIRPTPPSSTT